MSSHGLRKRVGWLFGSRRRQRPSSSPSGQACAAAAAGASELRDKVQGPLHRAAASRDRAWLRPRRWWFQRVAMEPRDQLRRTALAVATSHEADEDEDNLRLQEELERVEAELREMKENYLKSQHVIHDLKIALDDKDREELSAVQKLQDQLLAYLENQTTVKGLTEHVQCLEIQNTKLEATVQQQNDRIEALQRDLQASASLREMKENYLKSQHVIHDLKIALDDKDREELSAVQKLQDQLLAYLENQTTVKGLTEHVQCLEIQNTKLEATVQQQNDRIEALQRDLQASASLREMKENYLKSQHVIHDLKIALDDKDREELSAVQKLQDQLLAYLENQTTVKGLTEHVQCLEIQNTKLEATVQQQNDRIEALQRDLQASASLREMKENYLKSQHVIHDLKIALDDKDIEELSAVQKLQDQLLAYLENQTTVKGLTEHVQCLEIQNTKLEATVQQQNDRIEALQRDLQASASLREMKENYLKSQHVIHDLKIALDDKDREELSAVQKLQDQLLAYLENQTTVKGLTEHVQCLEIQNTKLEATVQQQNDRIEALQRDLQASASLREMKENYLKSQHVIHDLKIALDDKDIEELSAVQKLQDQLLAYLENQTTVKGLTEHVQCLEIQNTKLEATVQQQNDRIEALQRDLQASASLREMKENYLKSQHVIHDLKIALDDKDIEELSAVQKLQDQLLAYLENQTTVKGLTEHVQCLEIQNTKLEATVQQQNDRIEALQRDLQASASLREMEEKYRNSESCVQNLMATSDAKERETTASVQELQDQLSACSETVKQLEERVQRLGFENTSLESTVQQQSQKIEALQRDLQAATSAQAAAQEFIKQSRANHDSLTNQLKDRIRDLECELDRIKDTEQESTFQKQCMQAEMEKYKELYLKEVNISKWQAKELERANERLEEANAKHLRERHKSKSLITSSVVSGGLAATPVLHSPALGHPGSCLGLDRSLLLGESFLSQYEMILSSRKRFVSSVAKAQQELDEKIRKELKEATAELETGSAGSSKNLHVDQNVFSDQEID
ncbi:uncharacterized protein GJ701_003388 [Geothlypis trichas]